MPASPLSPRHPQYQGFVPLTNQPTASSMGQEADIPLAPIRSNASMGARKAKSATTFVNESLVHDHDDADGSGSGSAGPDEKKHFFAGGGRRRAKNAAPDDATISRRSTDSEVTLNFMGRLYTKIIGTSVVTRYLIYVIPVALLLAVPLVIMPLTDNTTTVPLGHHTDNSTTPPTTTDGPPLFRLFIFFEATWVALWAGKLVAHLIPAVFMFFCGVVSSGTRKYATVLRALEIPLSLFFWGLASWLIFKFLFQNDSFQWVYVIKQILGSLYVSSAVFLAEKAFVQFISIGYHQRSFANRIKASKHDIYLLGLMYDASRNLFPMYCPEFADEDYVINDSIEAMLGRGRKSAGPKAPMRLIGNVGRIGDKVTSVFGNLASEITGKQVFNPNSAHSIVVEALEKVRSSEAMARRIWMSFAVEDRDSLSLDDIEEVLGPGHKDDAEECFVAIDADGNGDISLDEMVRKVVEIGKERKAIANSMKDISQALAVFDKVLLFIVLLITIFVFLAFFQSSFISTLTTAGTTLLSLSFIFSVTAQEFLGSCIFLFVKHPYDVGDRVDINGPERMRLTVEKISLLYTAFVRLDCMQVVQVPNIQLNNLWIENVTRSHAMREVINVNVAYDTTFDDIELLRLEMEKFVRHPDNARDFQPDFSISVGGVNDLDKITLSICMKHKSNWHNDVVRATRRSKFMRALADALRAVPIHGPGGGGDPLGGPKNPTYAVAVSDDFATAARDKAAKEHDAERLVPLLDLSEDEDSSKDGKDGKDSKENREDKDSFSRGGSQLHKQRSQRSMLHAAASIRSSTGNGASFLGSKTQSQRGRRHAGDTINYDAGLSGMSSLAPGRMPSSASYRSNVSFDIERTAGSTSIDEPQRFAIPPPMQMQPMQQSQNPLQSAPTGPSGTGTGTGNPSRTRWQQ